MGCDLWAFVGIRAEFISPGTTELGCKLEWGVAILQPLRDSLLEPEASTTERKLRDGGGRERERES